MYVIKLKDKDSFLTMTGRVYKISINKCTTWLTAYGAMKSLSKDKSIFYLERLGYKITDFEIREVKITLI